jgi:hypothetical protein
LPAASHSSNARCTSMTIRAVRGDKFLLMAEFPADFRGPTFAYSICHYGAMFEMPNFPRLRTPRVTKNVFATLNARVWVRDPAARYARVVRTICAFRKQRAQGKPGARCTRSLACNVK